ncbi:hypothetical protein FAF44_50465 [Nonomuraea sp. MG754425]|uniref:hypothetical protein n=1 Tax=Nonomuraea sp. MG754425 TaxID=2570319 RepID=UPI001F1C29A7|nr:hypothetical protein [Nonomuraea sp. MG754425]MCF6476506.1 hypothetical protein [Nonomuraea sp. MG754425]
MKLATAPVRPLIAVGTGLAAVGAAALLGLPSLVMAPETRLAAAASAPPEGAYWHTRMLNQRIGPRQMGSGANRYWVVEQKLSEKWTAPDGKAWSGYRNAGAYPKSAADRKAWRHDGSPAKWTRTADGQYVKLSTEPDKGHVGPVRGNDDKFFLAGQRLTYDEVQRLPAVPNALKSWLSEAARVSRVKQNNVDQAITRALVEMLYQLPAPKNVRAAAYQALLTMPAVRSQGESKDSMGRAGAALSIDHPKAVQNNGLTIKDKTDLIVDTGTMLLLSESLTTKISGKLSFNESSTQTILEAGWTNTAPAVPALP